MTPVDTATGAAGRPIVVGTLPAAVALVPGGRSLLVAVKADDQLVEVSTATGKVVGKVGVGLEPDAVAVTPDGTTALVANFGDDTVTEVHLPSLTAGPTVPVGRQPVAVAVTPDGKPALVVELPGRDADPDRPSGPDRRVRPSPWAPSRWPWPSPPPAREALVADFETSSLTPVALPSLPPGPALPARGEPDGHRHPAPAARSPG